MKSTVIHLWLTADTIYTFTPEKWNMTYKRIRELREDHDLTQKYMAHYLNVIQRTYSRYERGERIIPPDVLCKIADFYNVSVDYLLERTDTKQPYPPSLLSRKTKDT